jgi:hypothetical protein
MRLIMKYLIGNSYPSFFLALTNQDACTIEFWSHYLKGFCLYSQLNLVKTSIIRANKHRIQLIIYPVVFLIILGCPNCKRTFCEKAYDRHVTFCSSKSKQLQQPPSEETLLARLKLDRRNKFVSNRISSTLSNTSPVITTTVQQPISAPITNKQTIKQKPSLQTEAFCFLSMRKKHSDSLARCPWCSKPYMPNCIHYCRSSKELFSIHSK